MHKHSQFCLGKGLDPQDLSVLLRLVQAPFAGQTTRYVENEANLESRSFTQHLSYFWSMVSRFKTI